MTTPKPTGYRSAFLAAMAGLERLEEWAAMTEAGKA